MRISFVAALFLAAGCGTPAGGMDAHWTGVDGKGSLSAPARAGYCAASGRILVDATGGDTAVGISWRDTTLRAESFPVAPPVDTTSAPFATVAVRYLHLADVRGFQGVQGTLHITDASGGTVSGHLEGDLQAVGRLDSLHFTVTFRNVPVAPDTTLCH